MASDRSRAWCFTAFGDISDNLPATYWCYGVEKCPTTGREHLQGYIYFKNARTFTATKNLLGSTTHLEPAKGTAQENRDYCSKDGTFREYGEIPKPGQRKDLMAVRDASKTMNIRTMLDNAIIPVSLPAINLAEKLRMYYEEGRRDKPEVRWYYGGTGLGKSRSVYEEFPFEEIYSCAGRDNSTLWFQGYDSHSVILLDDFRKNWMNWSQLLKFTDRYPNWLRTYGSMRQNKAKVIVFTAPCSPQEMFENNDEDITQLLRRIDLIKNFDEL